MGSFIGLLICIGVIVLVMGRMHRDRPSHSDPDPYRGPVVSSHRVRCPECDSKATLLIFETGDRQRVCDECGDQTWL